MANNALSINGTWLELVLVWYIDFTKTTDILPSRLQIHLLRIDTL